MCCSTSRTSDRLTTRPRLMWSAHAIVSSRATRRRRAISSWVDSFGALRRNEDGLRDVRPERLTADELAPARLYVGHDRRQLSLKLSVERRAGGRPPWAVAPAPAFMLLDLADERPLLAADVVRARDRVEQGDEASGDVRPERLTADELGSARWRSAHWIQDSTT